MSFSVGETSKIGLSDYSVSNSNYTVTNNNIAQSASDKIAGPVTDSQNSDNSLFLSVYKDVASQETHLITAKFGYVNAGGLVNHLNSAEDVANVLNNNQYTLVVQNEDLPAHLKEGIKAVTGGSISSIA